MSFVRKGIAVSGGQVLVTALTVVSTIIFSRFLGREGVGQIEVARSTTTLVVTFVTLGLGNASIYFINNQKMPVAAIVANSLKLGWIMTLLVTVGLSGSLLIFHDYFGNISVPVAIFFSMGVGILAHFYLLRPVLIAKLAARQMVMANAMNPIFLTTGTVLLAITGYLTPELALVMISVGPFASFAWVLFYLRNDIDFSIPFDWLLVGKMLSYGLKLAAVNILMVLCSSLTVLLLRQLASTGFSEAGLYGRAVGICGLASFIPITMGPLLYSKWSGVTGEARKSQVEMATRVHMTYASAVAIFLIFAGKYVLILLYGHEFAPAQYALRLLAIGTIFLSLVDVCTNLLASDGRIAVTAYILVGTLIVVVGTTYWAAPRWGSEGAAFGALCGNVFTAIASLLACRSLYGIRISRCLMVCQQDIRYMWKAVRG